jgi:hypothetical protein
MTEEDRPILIDSNLSILDSNSDLVTLQAILLDPSLNLVFVNHLPYLR